MLSPKYSMYLVKYKNTIEKFKKLSPENQEKVIEEGKMIIDKYYDEQTKKLKK